jgi:hypothetical protein
MGKQVHTYHRREEGSFHARYLIILFLCLIPVNTFAEEKLSYYSDYFSFTGRDAIGFVAFALDTNRGVDGPAYQAEHFGVLYDQKSGWVKLVGMGEYNNSQGALEQIPDSPQFSFEGQADTGLTIRSKENFLFLKIEPLIVQLRESDGNRIQNWGVAKAELHWKGREISGRVIYEGLVHHNWNRLTRTYTNTWDNFQGFYLALELGPPDTWRDLYLRSEGEGVNRRTKGFMTASKWIGAIHSTRFKAYEKAFNFGFYRWPQRWDIEVQLKGLEDRLPGELTLRQISRENQGNWIVGGFAMAVVEGELLRNGKAIPVLGFVELIK